MNKIFIEDFYDWHPTTLMASKSRYNEYTFKHTVVRLYSEADYKMNILNYSVSESLDGEIRYWKFIRLDDAVDFYNEQLKENDYG